MRWRYGMKRRIRGLAVTLGVVLALNVGVAAGALADPPGNNGTVKIDGVAFDSHPNNEPHVGCTFQIDFTGFDAGQQVSASLVGHPPTGGGVLASQSTTLDGTGAGSITLDLSGALGGITPHPQQGYHIKLTVETGQGAGKHKVFWVECGPIGSAEIPPTGGGETIGEVASGNIEGDLTNSFNPFGTTGTVVVLLAALACVCSTVFRKALLAHLGKRTHS
jgi:hypothetical protein